MLKKLRYLLWPLSLLYGLIVFIRNKGYDWGILKSTSFHIPVICVGNLAAGGSGKTPTVEYLVKLLSPQYKIAILSRGYGRKTKGFIWANAQSNSLEIGDEPMQYQRKFAQVTVAVCENRVNGINQLKATHDVIILDDAFQHRAVKAGLNILLFEYQNTQSVQLLLPAGNLRESYLQTKRAEMVLITKSPANIETAERARLQKRLKLGFQSLSFANIKYQKPVHLFNQTILTDFTNYTLILLTGIANPKPLISYLSSFTNIARHFDFPDHYRFTKKDLQRVIAAFTQNTARKKIILTTEKDYQRLSTSNLKDLLLTLPIYYLPIEFDLMADDKANFEETIRRYVASA